MKNILKKKFEEAYPGKRLLAVHLDGFSHSIIYDSGTKDSDIEQEHYSGYMSQSEKDHYGMGKVESVLGDIGHRSYQNKAEEIIYVMPNKR